MTLDLAHLKLSKGAHVPNGEACVMEAVSQVAGEKWSDKPACTDPSLAAYLRVINDASPQWVRDELAKRISAIAKAQKLPDSWRWVWAEAARQSAIRALGPERGAALKACGPIIDKGTAGVAHAVAAAATAAANAANSAAREAAYAAANAAYAAAPAAANAAAANAAYAAAAAHAAPAADHAAYAAARDAAYAVASAANTVEWKEAIALVDRAIKEARGW